MEGYSSQGGYGLAVDSGSPMGVGFEGSEIHHHHQQQQEQQQQQQQQQQEEDDEQQQEIDQEDTWAVVGAFFEGKGLVSQQVESFNDFASYKLQEIIDALPPIEIKPSPQYRPEEDVELGVCYRLKFVL
ncbi:DNA-directed RNA polymerase II subunit RPB2, putative [Eimeria mitis]|uniref:DNA-directed RNA polymerase II subunit RPB2, putative n=1 Tax=Eimeria mitis TaxID=44415 RepID=U6K3C9_9EIME|nr:DNA-directed RNA polymerase II subunit RPB2, putative [Eimeria mitis]CDJ32189.1 DNA-directed RNA polymerase II subunit RPB2, putative [Eimeria mitis]